MSLLKTRNLLHEEAPKTKLTNPEVAGTIALRVENSSALTSGWGLQIGEVGEEQTEVVLGTADNIGTISVATTDFSHPADTPVYFIKYNQVVFERSTTGTSGTATPLANGTIEYQADSNYTIFDDTSGSSTYGYRTYFRNSALAVNSTESDWVTFAGHSYYSLGKMRERSRQRLWDANYLDDDTIDNLLNEWKFEMQNEVNSVNEDYPMGTVDVGFGTDGFGTITTADFVSPRRVWVSYDGFQNTYQSTKMNVNDYLPNESFTSTHPMHNFVNDAVLEIHPSDNAGTARVTFYRFGTVLVNDTDELPVPMRSYTKSFIDYVHANALLKDGKQTEYRDKLTEAMASKQNFIQNIIPRDHTGPTYIDIVEGISVEESLVY